MPPRILPVPPVPALPDKASVPPLRWMLAEVLVPSFPKVSCWAKLTVPLLMMAESPVNGGPPFQPIALGSLQVELPPPQVNVSVNKSLLGLNWPGANVNTRTLRIDAFIKPSKFPELSLLAPIVNSVGQAVKPAPVVVARTLFT